MSFCRVLQCFISERTSPLMARKQYTPRLETDTKLEEDKNTLRPATLTFSPSSECLKTMTSTKQRQDDSSSRAAAKALVQSVDKLLLSGFQADAEKAFEMLQKNKDMVQGHSGLCWRMAKATYMMADAEGDKGNKENRKQMVYQSLKHATKALETDDKDPNCHKWYAMTLCQASNYEGIAAKIQSAHVFKQHIQKAINLDPNDSYLHYLLGRWCIGVYGLSWVEKRVASSLFGAPPSATVDEALESFLKADKLPPHQQKEVMVYLAKCYAEKKEYSKTASWLKEATRLHTPDASNTDLVQEMQQLQHKYQQYM